MTDRESLRVSLRRCWVRKDNLRVSAEHKWIEPCWRAVVVESVQVAEGMRRQGVFKRFITELCKNPEFELVIVEGVGNPHLADALMRWGWDFDSTVMDFYFYTGAQIDAAATR